ncbi:MAG: hypothetical protein GY930_15330 [bacterium]|nr:hypothetical protein [bacterium]
MPYSKDLIAASATPLVLSILVAVFFAGLILVTAQWKEGFEHSELVSPMFIAAWFVT